MLMPKPSNVLSGLPKRLLSEVFEGAVAHKLPDGEVLFRAGNLGDGCYQIQTGLVKVVVTSERGDERIISLLGPDAIVGELSMIDGGPRSRTMSEWRKRGVVTRSSNYYCISNPTALARDMKSETGGERKTSAFGTTQLKLSSTNTPETGKR
jgi:hypothetical protein